MDFTVQKKGYIMGTKHAPNHANYLWKNFKKPTYIHIYGHL